MAGRMHTQECSQSSPYLHAQQVPTELLQPSPLRSNGGCPLPCQISQFQDWRDRDPVGCLQQLHILLYPHANLQYETQQVFTTRKVQVRV